jgi:hypothetical protein
MRSSPVLRKALITSFVGAVTYALTEFLLTDQDFQLVLTVFVGGLTLVIQFMVDSDRRIAGFEQLLADLNESTSLLAQLEKSPWHGESILGVVRSAVALTSPSPLVQDFVEAETVRFSELLETLREGRANYDGEDRDWILSLTRCVRVGIDAISTPQTDAAPDSAYGFWRSDLGLRFLAEQRIAARRVPVRRVFVLPGNEPPTNPDFLQICKDQIEQGVQVRWVNEPDLRSDLRNALVGLVIFDGAVSYEVTPAQLAATDGKPSIVSTQMVTRTRQVDARRRYFNDVWAVATPLSIEEPAR